MKAIYQTKYVIKEKKETRSFISKIIDYLSPSESYWNEELKRYKKNGDAHNEKIITDSKGVKKVIYDVPGTPIRNIIERKGFVSKKGYSPSDKAQYYVKRKNNMNLTSKQRAYAQKRFEELSKFGK